MRRGFDPYIVETLMENLKGHGPILHPLSKPAMIQKGSNDLMTFGVLEGEDETFSLHHGFDCIMNAAGRKPVTERLDLDKAGVETERGFIKVDEYENTNVPGVYALGDITTTGYELTPVAIAAGRRLADRIFGGEPKARIEYNTIATVVFSHPPIGMIGLTEPDAKKEYGDDKIVVKEARFGPMWYAFNDDKHKMKTAFKLVLKLPEERIVGLHMMGDNCDEMMQGFAVAVRMGATRADFEASVATHPTSAEEMVTFGGWGQEKVGNETRPQLPPYLKADAVQDENAELRKQLEQHTLKADAVKDENAELRKQLEQLEQLRRG
jgi:glutathione reductase (NADPH)